MYVYVITNKINHKRYVGITTQTIAKRWEQHKSIARQISHRDSKSIFKKAIRKYGEDAWIIEQLDTADSLEELKEKEIYWIDKLKTYAFDENSWGYNSTRGGDYVDERNFRPVYVCDIVQGKIIKECNSIKEAERFTKARIENIEKKNISSGGFCILDKERNKNFTEKELVDKIHSLYPTLVYKLDLEGNIIELYRNTTEASLQNNCPSGNLIAACENKRRLCHGFQWCYQKDIKNRLGKPPREIATTSVPVVQYSLGGIKIREWKSISEAEKAGKGSNSHISQCCKGTRESCGGFRWRYADEEIEQLEPIFTKRKVQCIETKEIFETPNHAAKKYNYAHQTVKKMCMNDGRGSKEFHFVWWDDLDI